MFLFKILESRVAILTLNKIHKKNCIGSDDFKELYRILNDTKNEDIRAMIIEANGDHFTSGLDIKNLPKELTDKQPSHAHKSLAIQSFLREWQATFTLFEKLKFPVISCIHGYCIGLGIDLISATDIRFTTKCAKFSVAEVNVGICADVGTLQRLPKIVGNQSLVRELCFTGRVFTGKEAHQMGLCSRLFDSKGTMMEEAHKLAQEIAAKDPIAIYGTKKYLVDSLESTTQEGLESVLIWNSTMILNNGIFSKL